MVEVQRIPLVDNGGPLSRVCEVCNAQIGQYCRVVRVNGTISNTIRAPHPCRMGKKNSYREKQAESSIRGAKRSSATKRSQRKDV